MITMNKQKKQGSAVIFSVLCFSIILPVNLTANRGWGFLNRPGFDFH
jgi:hypothetical protein